MATPATALWMPRRQPNARLGLFCFPYAGAGASIFREWAEVLPPTIQLCSVQLPGREWRRYEPAKVRMEELIDHLMPEVVDAAEAFDAFVLFGYSMGANIAFALARRLRQAGERLPGKLILAASRAPQVLARSQPIYRLKDEEFLLTLQHLGGIPAQVLADPELLKMAVSVLRADFELLGTHRHQEEPALPIPFTVYGGSEDPIASRSDLAGWRDHTASRFTLRIFSGGHFFINGVRGQVQRTLVNDIGEHAKAWEAGVAGRFESV